MRKKAGSWMIKVILALIVVVFMFWGVGSFRNRQATVVASVDGIPIMHAEYNRAYNDLLDQLRRQFGDSLNDEAIKMMGVRKQALDRIINRHVMLAEAKRLGFRVSDEELIETIQGIPSFQRDGAFDQEGYLQVVNQLRLTPEAFEQDYRDSMLIESLRSFVTDKVKVSENEVVEWYNWQNAEVSIEYLLVDPATYKDIEPTPEALDAYYKEQQDNYKTEPKIKVRYVRFDAKDYKDRADISEDEVRDYYDTHTEEFGTPKTVEARHIIIKVDSDADDVAVENARSRLLEILEKAREGQDFATLAKTYSEGPSKTQGGLLGAFKKEDMVAPFSEKAFSMEAGDISEPVRTRFGWHLIKVEKVNPANTQAFESSADNIRNKLVLTKAREFAYDSAETFLDLVFSDGNLSEIAEEQSLAVQTTDFFNRTGPTTITTGRSQFTAAALSLKEDEVSEIIELGDDFCLIQLADSQPAAVPPLADVEDRVRTDWVKMRQDEKARADADILLAELKKGSPMLDAGKAYGLSPQATSFFKRNDPIDTIGTEPGITSNAFKLTTKKDLADQVIKGQKGFYIIRLKERKTPDIDGLLDQKEAIIQRLKGQKGLKRYNQFLTQLRKNSEIEIVPEFIN
jgi:peptidyl-prolyl cis-trans isomerase D